LREAEVQQPNTTATFSLESRSLAAVAKRPQSDAGSTIFGSSFRPRRHPVERLFAVMGVAGLVDEQLWTMPQLKEG
jgi:hypothetical protein